MTSTGPVMPAAGTRTLDACRPTSGVATHLVPSVRAVMRAMRAAQSAGWATERDADARLRVLAGPDPRRDADRGPRAQHDLDSCDLLRRLPDVLLAGTTVGRLRDRPLHGQRRRARRPVGPLERCLEPGAQPVVPEPEEAHLDDVGVARRAANDVAVDRGLGELVRDGHVLGAGVAAEARRVDLPPDLVQVEPEAGSCRRLRRAVEGVPERLLEPVEVHEPGVRPAVAPLERVGRAVRIRVEAERVHQRPRTATRPVPGAERAQEPDRRGRDVAPRFRLVVPARRQPDADDLERGIDGLERVVPRREIAAEARCGHVRAPCVELRPPERGLVRLVPDDELPHLRVRAGDRGDVRREHRRRADPRLDLARRVRVDGEHDADAGVERPRDGDVEKLLVLDLERLARPEANGDDRLLEPNLRHLAVHRRPAVRRELRGVVVRADVGGRGRRRSGEERYEKGRCHSVSSHHPVPSRAGPLSPLRIAP